jgi:hypothetical protein
MKERNKGGNIGGHWVLFACFSLVFCIAGASASLNATLSNQGTEVRSRITGDLLAIGDLQVTIWDSLNGGILIYNETFGDAIIDGSWNVMLGENSSNPLQLEFMKVYYYDYNIDGNDMDFTNYEGATVERQLFHSPLGEITDDEISDSTNLTLGQKLAFALGGVIDNIRNGWIRITGGLNVTEDVVIGGALNVTGDVTFNGVSLGNSTFGSIVGYTSSSYDGDISNGSLSGYAAVNAICDAEYSGSHFCLKSEILRAISNGDYLFSGTAWFQNGPPGYTANADDCSGWTTNSNTYLGPFWNWDANSQAGRGALTNCAQTKQLMCCGGGNL